MCKRNSQDKNEASPGCVREIPQIKQIKKPALGCVRETPHRQIKQAWNV